MASRSIISKPVRPKRNLFPLTPLIDVMFLLLIFFMLSSQIAPYSLLPIGQVASDSSDDARPQEPPAPSRDVAIRVAQGIVVIDGRSVSIGEAVPVLADLVRQGAGSFIVLSTRSATVQDIVTTLEGLQAAGAGSIVLVNAGRSAT